MASCLILYVHLYPFGLGLLPLFLSSPVLLWNIVPLPRLFGIVLAFIMYYFCVSCD